MVKNLQFWSARIRERMTRHSRRVADASNSPKISSSGAEKESEARASEVRETENENIHLILVENLRF